MTYNVFGGTLNLALVSHPRLDMDQKIWIWIQEFFEGFFDIARSGIFPHLGPRRIFTKILRRMYLQSRKTLLSLGSHPDSRFELRIWTRSILAEVCAFGMCVFYINLHLKAIFIYNEVELLVCVCVLTFIACLLKR